MKYMLTLRVRVGADDRLSVSELGKVLEDVTEAILINAPGLDGYNLIGAEVGEVNNVTSFTATVSEYGNSLAINVTKHASEISIKKGDRVDVIVRKLAGGKE